MKAALAPSALPEAPACRPQTVWQAEAVAHEARLATVLGPYLSARSRGQKQPVLDFLFEYYRFRPAHLRRWSPGVGVALQGPAAEAFLARPGFVQTSAGVCLDPSLLPTRRRASLRWIHDLLAATATRPPRLGCFGLHEWAMVYRTADVRHGQLPLRLPPPAIDAVVEGQPLRCTHFDAFRFYTPSAQPLNGHQLTRADMPAMEQPGCLHTNMDLYRWAYKGAPWIPSSLLSEAFLLACRIREVDMRASPYDLAAFGYAPIPIETPEGRRQYQQHQRAFALEAAPLRQRLTAAFARVLKAAEQEG